MSFLVVVFLYVVAVTGTNVDKAATVKDMMFVGFFMMLGIAADIWFFLPRARK